MGRKKPCQTARNAGIWPNFAVTVTCKLMYPVV